MVWALGGRRRWLVVERLKSSVVARRSWWSRWGALWAPGAEGVSVFGGVVEVGRRLWGAFGGWEVEVFGPGVLSFRGWRQLGGLTRRGDGVLRFSLLISSVSLSSRFQFQVVTGVPEFSSFLFWWRLR